jgi:hypothetical protein
MMSKKILSASEMLEVISKGWATTEDIMKLGACGTNKALDIRKELINKLKNEGYSVANGLIPMNIVVEYFNIDINYLRDVINKK